MKKEYVSPMMEQVVLTTSPVLTVVSSADINSGQTINNKNQWDAPELYDDEEEEEEDW